MANTYPYVGVTNGKFHKPADIPEGHKPWRDALLMECGRSLVASNYFSSRTDALAYRGNRAQYLCAQCEATNNG